MSSFTVSFKAFSAFLEHNVLYTNIFLVFLSQLPKALKLPLSKCLGMSFRVRIVELHDRSKLQIQNLGS